MPVYHFILHSYGSWLPDQPTGFHTRKLPHTQPRNKGLADYYRMQLKQQIVEFTESQQKFLLDICRAPPSDDSYRIHAAAVVANHIHAIISWSTEHELAQMKAKFKIRLTKALNQQTGSSGSKWFCRGIGAGKIRDMDHLVELVKRYIPGHGKYVWIEEKIRLRYQE